MDITGTQQSATEGTPSSVLPIQLDPDTLKVLNNKLDLTNGLAQGDVFYVDSHGEIKRLAVGTSGQPFTSGGANANPYWGGSLSLNFTAFTTFAINDAVYVEQGVPDTQEGQAELADAGGGASIGTVTQDTTGKQKAAQSFKFSTQTTLSTVSLRIAKSGAPADNLVIALQADSTGNPSDVDLATITVSGASLTTLMTTYFDLAFSSSVVLTANTTYWLVFRRSGALSDTDNYALDGKTSSVYANGQSNWYDGVSWGHGSALDCKDFYFICGPSSLGVLKTQANITGKFKGFIGFITTAASSGSTAIVQMYGVLGGFSGLTLNAQYYLSDTAGLISTTPGSNTRKVGIAVSTTSLLITNTW